jgi:hypothetical protein
MQYSLHSEVFSVLRREGYADFRADPNTQDPTVKEGLNAFAILALKEPHKSEAGTVPEQARKKRRNISNTLNNIKSDDTRLIQLFATYQNYLTPAFDLLADTELVEEHLDKLWKRRMAALQEQFKIIKKHSAQSKWEADVREHAIALGFAERDLELAATEILGTLPKSPKPRKTDAKPTTPTNSNASEINRKINLGYSTLLYCLLPSIASLSFSLLLIAMQPGSFLDIKSIFQKKEDTSVNPNIKPFGYSENVDAADSRGGKLKLNNVSANRKGTFSGMPRGLWYAQFDVSNPNSEEVSYFYRFPKHDAAWQQCKSSVLGLEFFYPTDVHGETVEFKIVGNLDGDSSVVTQTLP